MLGEQLPACTPTRDFDPIHDRFSVFRHQLRRHLHGFLSGRSLVERDRLLELAVSVMFSVSRRAARVPRQSDFGWLDVALELVKAGEKLLSSMEIAIRGFS